MDGTEVTPIDADGGVIADLQGAAAKLRDAATRGVPLDPGLAMALAAFLDHGRRISERAILREGEAGYTPGLPLMQIVRAVNREWTP